MKRLNKISGLLLAAVLITSPAYAAKPKYVFYMVGDGLGAAQRQFSEFFLKEKDRKTDEKLLMDTFPVSGLNSTYATNTLITDSAAAATALATGHKTNKGYIGQDPNGKDLETLIEEAEKHGMSTGLITTTRITHATPAAFAAHTPDRNDENGIAEDYLDSGVDFFAGGGIRHFIPKDVKIANGDAVGHTIKSKRKDDKDLVKEFSAKGYDTFIGKEGVKKFNATDFNKVEKVLALFTYTHMPYEIDRENKFQDCPSIADMTQAAIDVLSKNKDGFFMMIEGGRIDHAAHANDPTGVIYDTIAFDKAIDKAYNFYKQHPEETLIVVVADHETGGMGLGFDSQGYKLDMGQLLDVKASIEDNIFNGAGLEYKQGKREAFLTMLNTTYGLDNLTAEEKAMLEKGMDESDAGKTFGYYKYDPAAIAATHILSQRANISWTTTIHTASMVPMSAIGVDAQQFGGYKDNTEVAKAMAKVLGFSI
ncbi:alkaline phosphatase [Desulfogranum japonicum]|uniref:alkaline phosphatase n=1 Tax=Desulfogranum japonicum TaxID=231447 RepID=UPI000416816A|nr:alkaline phosphatase [Desulfogranum japonicum]